MNHLLYHCHLWLIMVHWFRDFLLIHLPLMPYQHWQHTNNFSCGLIRWNIEYISSLISKYISNLQYKMKHIFKKLGLTPCKAEQPLQAMELQEKVAQKYESIQEIMQSIRITNRPPSRNRKWNQLSQLWRTSTKVISIEKT